jgi:hypothetical protein
MLSYKTALERLGFDYDNEFQNMTEEFDQVMDGTFGIIGSPWQQAAKGFGGGDNIQDTQRAPTGTPSDGRPKGQPAKKKAPDAKPTKPKPTKPKRAQAGVTVEEILVHLDEESYDLVLEHIKKQRTKLKDGE